MTAAIDPARLAELTRRERKVFESRHPASMAAWAAGRAHLVGGVPMTWMLKAAGGFPVFLEGARGARLRDIDGHEYVDFCLGDTGAMAGHSPQPFVDAVHRRLAERGGATAMLPTEDAAWVAAELAARFGVQRWSFALTATDANRWMLRIARQLTGRPKILVFSYCYHGSVDESFVVSGDDGKVVSREGNVGAPVDPALTTRVVEFNDVDALARELSNEDVACVLMEPALTNIGIVLPDPGFLDDVRWLTRQAGTLLVVDETHTISAGWGGATRAWGLTPDAVTIGKAIGGGVPIGAYGLAAELADALLEDRSADIVDTGGVGGTLAGNALSLTAARATLEHVLTPDAFAHMTTLAERFTAGVQETIDRHSLPWSVTRLGARAEYRFIAPAPRSGGESAAAAVPELDDLLHLYAANRGILMTPFHNMALMCPATTAADVDLHTEVFAAAVAELVG
ncbi:MAG TPA: transaminase [Mycobacteriales bacterium]|jgi:glutamate-1-semialdehyde 2,1-aminomutase|nr:transaminase [Mycobacteriales bacterium]